MLIGTVVSGRAGLTLAIVSSVWCGFVALLELRHALPPQLGPSYSPINAWSAVTVTLIFAMVLLRNGLDSLRAMHAQQVILAAQRDEALRRSIQSQKMELVGNLAGGVAHDFNNLLSVIGSVSELLRSELGGREAEREMLDDLDEATSRAVLMTRQLLSFTRTEPSELSDVDVGEEVRAIAPMLRRLVGPAIAVDIEAPQGAIVRATRVGLEQVLLNLAVNARDAMPSGGTLGIHVQVDEDAVRVAVKDTGVGMDEPTRARIFEPFFTTKSTGTGLGLATVRERVVEFGGTITVESERGAGSVFALRLTRAAGAPASSTTSRSATASAPASAASAPASLPPAADGPSPTTAARLLLVDDDAFVRRAMTRLLEQSGFEVVAVSNGAEALALLEREHAFACVVSDVVMPVLDGEALATRLSALDPSLPLVLMSGNRQPSASLLGPRRGFVDKPVDRKALLDTIRRVTDEAKAAPSSARPGKPGSVR
jgi:signal transduction histidine kinase/ActR/RegA family two-component response regulator